MSGIEKCRDIIRQLEAALADVEHADIDSVIVAVKDLDFLLRTISNYGDTEIELLLEARELLAKLSLLISAHRATLHSDILKITNASKLIAEYKTSE